jgi:hypothetical protein
MLHSPFKIFLASFGSVDFSFGSFVAGLPESMRQDQSPTDEEKTQDSIGLDFKLKDLVHFGQWFCHSLSFENIAYMLLREQACDIHHSSK